MAGSSLNIVTGGDPAEQRAYGDFLGHDDRYARTGEFVEVLRRAWAGGPFDYAGEHYRVDGGGLATPLADAAAGLLRRRVPGRRDGGRPTGRRVPDVGRAAGVDRAPGSPGSGRSPPSRAAPCAPACGCTSSPGDTAAEAWAEADRLLAGMSPERIAAAQARFAGWTRSARPGWPR